MRVLLIEDHQDLANNLGDYLGALGHRVDFAADGASGLGLALSNDYDAIILDRLLPRIDGATVCRRLRAQSASRMPVLMLTAMDTVADKVEGFAAGADDYLVKPFAMAELVARLDALQRRTSNGQGKRLLTVHDLNFDLNTLQAQRAGRVLTLTPALRKLLQLLMQETHRVVSRQELEYQLWGDDTPENDVLRAHMYALRNAIDGNQIRKLVHTVHGTGYRLADLGD